MRFNYAYLTLAVAAAAAACGTEASNATKTDSGTNATMTDSGTMALVDTSGMGPAEVRTPPTIVLICGNNTARFRINAWRYEVGAGADARWQLGTAGNVDSIMINPRASEEASWPLEGDLPIVIKKGGPSGRKPKPPEGPRPTPFNYTITGVCGAGTSDEFTVVIDPIMILPR